MYLRTLFRRFQFLNYTIFFIFFQVVSLALYVYFMAALLGRQFVPYAEKNSVSKWEEPDMYFPFFTSLQVSFCTTQKSTRIN